MWYRCPGTAQIAPNGKVQDEVLDRVEEVPETGLYLRFCYIGISAPATQRRFHTDEHVIDGALGFGIGQEDVALRSSANTLIRRSRALYAVRKASCVRSRPT